MVNRHTPDDRLDGWEAIAKYMGWTPRTVIRWEKLKGLPIRRLAGGKRQPVYAFRSEIDEWFQKTGGSVPAAPPTPIQPKLDTISIPLYARNPRMGIAYRVFRWVVVLAVLLAAGIGIAWRLSTQPEIQITGVTQLTDDGITKRFLITDGKRLYFSEETGDRAVLSTMEASGGPVRRIPVSFLNPEPVDITADGKFLLVLSDDGPEEEHRLWIVPTAGGVPYEMAGIKCRTSVWSPDGDWVAFSSGSAIYLVSRNGGSTRLLTTLDGLPETIRWLPDGKHLLVLLRHLPESSASLWQVNLDDDLKAAPAVRLQTESRELRTFQSLARAEDGYFSILNDSIGGRLLYFRPRAWWHAGTIEITSVSAQLQGIDDLTADGDARRLFVVSSQRQHGELVRYDLSKQGFTMMLPGTSATYVDVTKNLQLVTYVNTQDDTLWVSRFDGTGRRQLDSAGMSVQLPRWSPDGKLIAFMGKQPKRPWRIFIEPLAGGSPKEASQSNDNQGAPTWSPDGKSMMYGNVYCQGEETCAIHKINLANGEVTTIPGSKGFRTARWSPDGKHIASLSPAEHKLLVFDEGPLEWRGLAENINGDDVSWSSDSRFIYTKSSMNGQASILRVPVGGGPVQTVLNLGSFSQAAGELDTWFSLTPDNALLLNRWLNTSEIYSLNYREQ